MLGTDFGSCGWGYLLASLFEKLRKKLEKLRKSAELPFLGGEAFLCLFWLLAVQPEAGLRPVCL